MVPLPLQCGLPPSPPQVVVLGYARTPAPPRKRQITLLVLLPAAYAACAVALALITMVDVESVLATGPLIFGLGLSALVVAATSRTWLAMAVSIGHCSICLLLFVLVVLLDWGPSQAERPFQAMGCIYLALAIVPTVLACRQLSRSVCQPAAVTS